MMRLQKKTGGIRRALCALLASGLLLNPVCMAEAEVPELLEPVGVNLDTVQAYIGDISQITLYNGLVTPHVEPMYFTVDGVIEEVNVVRGQRVCKGDVLYTLDSEAQELRMKALQRQIEAQELEQSYAARLAELDRAMLGLELQELMTLAPGDQEAISLKKLDMEQLEADLALEQELRDMEMERLQNELSLMEADLTDTQICAPFDGTVTFLKGINRGSAVSAYEPLVYLADETRLAVTTEYISAGYLNAASEYYALIGEKRYEITPVELDTEEYVSMTLAGETILSEFIIDVPDDTLKAGMYAGVCLDGKSMKDVLLVPRNAVYSDANGRYVYVIEDGERIRKDVRLGVTTDWLASVTEGLEEGEIVYVKE